MLRGVLSDRGRNLPSFRIFEVVRQLLFRWHRRNNRSQQLFNRRNVRNKRIPDDIEIDVRVIVHKTMTQTSQTLEVKLGMAHANLFGKVVGILAFSYDDGLLADAGREARRRSVFSSSFSSDSPSAPTCRICATSARRISSTSPGAPIERANSNYYFHG